MERMEEYELIELNGGGFNITGAVVNALTSAGKAIYELGRSLGDSIRRISTNKLCPIK